MEPNVNSPKVPLLPLHSSFRHQTKTATPNDAFHLAYITYFTLGAGYLLPWNAFITAVDYYSYTYPSHPVNRIFAVVCQPVMLFSLLVTVMFFLRKPSNYVRINLGLGLFTLAMVTVPVLDWAVIKGRGGVDDGAFGVTIGAVGVTGLAGALVQGGLVGSAGELPARYMQAVVAGTAASGSFAYCFCLF